MNQEKNKIFLGICNVMVTLIPIPIISGLLSLLAHATSSYGDKTVSSFLYSSSHVIQEVYPLLLCVYFSLFLSNKYKLSRAMVITPSLSTMFILMKAVSLTKHDDNFFEAFVSSSVFLSIIVPIFVANLLKRISEKRFFKSESLPLVVQQTVNLIVWTLLAIFSFIFCFEVVYEFLCLALDSAKVVLNSNEWVAPEYLQIALYLFFKNITWFFGINGANFIGEYELYAPQGSLVLTSFLDQYSALGGSGSTLSLVICMILCWNYRYKALGSISLLFGMFNINELVIFGVPIMLNPFMMVPFILIPIVQALIAYFFLSLGVIEPVIDNYNWMLPTFYNTFHLYGWLSNEMLLQILNFTIGVLIYFPFFKRISNLTFYSSVNMTSDKFFDYEDSRQALGIGDVVGQVNKSINAQRNIERLQSTGKFELFYQPICSENKDSIVSVEALLRHRSHEGKITPPTFITDFQLTGMIVDLDLWVIEKALLDFKKIDIPLDNELENIAINVSPITFLSDSFIKNFVEIVLSSDVAFSEITLEITEDVLISDESGTVAKIAELRGLGVSIALDDFGSGYSSLGYLSKYKFDKVKIDRALTNNIDTEIGSKLFMLTTQIVKTLGAVAIVEGVETERQLKSVNRLGPCLVQGYYFFRPMSLSALNNLLTSKSSKAIDKVCVCYE